MLHMLSVQLHKCIIKITFRGFPGGPVVKNPPSNAGDAGLIPGRGTKIPHASGQLSPRSPTTEPMHPGAHTLQRKIPHASTKIPQPGPDAAKKKKNYFHTNYMCIKHIYNIIHGHT